MTRLTGKVISRPLTRVPSAGMQVWVPNLIGQWIVGTLSSTILHDLDQCVVEQVPKNGTAFGAALSKCKELCIEYKKETTEPWRDWKPVVMRLKYSQWQSAIDNGEVDTGKEVEFEIITSKSMNKQLFPDLAKIIPAKKPVWSQSDVIEFVKQAYALGATKERETYHKLLDKLYETS